MALDHRRLLATALGRLRGKLKYRPVVFELLPTTFSLLRLQRVVEALAGVRLHKQNFRRLSSRAAWSRARGCSSPGRSAGRRSCSASVARCCASAGHPAWPAGATLSGLTYMLPDSILGVTRAAWLPCS